MHLKAVTQNTLQGVGGTSKDQDFGLRYLTCNLHNLPFSSLRFHFCKLKQYDQMIRDLYQLYNFMV